jgi:DNA-binding transcriptional LysR family regulator
MDLRDFEYLACLADVGNFGRAAKALGVDTSTVSRRVGRVEDELGVALFERARAGTRLTAAGTSVMVHVRRALAKLDAIKRKVAADRIRTGG